MFSLGNNQLAVMAMQMPHLLQLAVTEAIIAG